MIGMLLAAAVLVVLGSVLALSEASLSRVTRVRALMLQAEGRKHSNTLVGIQGRLPAHLNSIYLGVMIAQNGSAVLVAVAAERTFSSLGVTIASIVFTFFYFVAVEATCKTWAVLRSESVALAVSPFVVLLERLLRLPTRFLMGISNKILPRQEAEPHFEQNIRSLADIGHEEGGVETMERAMIHSIFRLTDTLVREVMTPRPDVVALPASASLDEAADAFAASGYSRLPVHNGRLDETVGVLHAKDVLRASRDPKHAKAIAELIQPTHFVPESQHVPALLERMQRERYHLAMVMDEFGSVAGLVTLEDLLEEIVGEIEDEHDQEEPTLAQERDGFWKVHAGLSVQRLNEAIGVDFPSERWDTVGGLLMGMIGRPLKTGDAAELLGFRLTAERVQGRRIRTLSVTRLDEAADPIPTAASRA